MRQRNRREFLLATGAAAAGALSTSAWPRRAFAQAASTIAPSEWDYRTAKETADALQARKISTVELTDHVIARIQALDQKLNAVVVRDFDRAREAAKAADAALGRGERRPLLGVPITIKESFNVAGLPTTWGIVAAKGFVPQEDAVTVARLKAAGAVILGKTNVPLMLADWQSFNDIYGTTNNPWDLGRTPGGSSGGSAAALAAGFGPLSLGSDIGGSLRVPPNFCGVYGHKPTYGIIPTRGHAPPGAPPLPYNIDLTAERLRGAVLARAGLRARWRKLFGQWDVVICPTMPTPPYPHDHSIPDYARHIDIDGKEYPYQDQLVWAGVATAPGLPATAAPIDRSDTGLPIGVQIVGPYLEDRTTIAFAELMEREFGGFVLPPGYAG